jgi:hypothetical protein
MLFITALFPALSVSVSRGTVHVRQLVQVFLGYATSSGAFVS